MKSNHDRVRTPDYMRPIYGYGFSDKDLSVGDVLRKARKALIIRQIALFFLFLIVVAVAVASIIFGAFDGALEFFSDRFL